jgi:mono/diheme cytochrome c family protein
VSEGVFSAAQAVAGRAVYARSCAACHGANFEPAPGSPPLKGAAFLANWRGRSLGELHAKVRTMPPGAADSLPGAEYIAVLAYMLEANGFPPGSPLPADEASLRAIGLGE